MPIDTRDWYDTPLYYDIVFDAGTAREADFLEAVWSAYGQNAAGDRARRLIEPACGSGRLLGEMARRGWEVSGFDANGSSLAFARDRMTASGLKATIWQDRMESFTVPAGVTGDFELAHCLVSTFKYLRSEEDARSHLRRVGDSLRPGGLVVLGIHLSDYMRTKQEHERWVGRRGDVEVVCNTRTWPPDRKSRTENLRCRLRVTENGVTREQETRWQFRTYDARQLRTTIRAALPEFAIVACHDFHHLIEVTRKFDDEYSDLVVILRKPG
jgi:SAM-dependent methyltransferase